MMSWRRWLTFGASLVVVLTVSISVFQNRWQVWMDDAMAQARTGHPTAETVVSGVNQSQPSGPTPEGMVWVPGGTFWMGCEGCGMPDALPVHQVAVDGFWMDETPVTNEQFSKFVNATGYVTVAERVPDANVGFRCVKSAQ